MPSSEERLKILQMIENGKISADEGARLIAALGKRDERKVQTGSSISSSARWLRVRVTDTITGHSKVSVNIPISLVNVGFKMGARFAPELEESEYAQIVDAIRSGATGKIIDVLDEEDGERVEIFVE